MASGASHEGERAGVEARGVDSVDGERNESCWGERTSEGDVERVAEHESLPLPSACCYSNTFTFISFPNYFKSCWTSLTDRADEAHQGRVTLDYNQFVSTLLAFIRYVHAGEER